MHPVLFSIGSFHAYSYGLMIAVGALLGIFLSEWRANRRGMDGELVFNTAIWGLLAGLLGAKLTYVASNFKDLFTDPKAVLGTDGFTVYGGIVLGVIVGGLLLKRGLAKNEAALSGRAAATEAQSVAARRRFTVGEYLDLFIPQVALAQGFGRIGCFMAGCCYGKEVPASVHGIVFPAEAVAPSGVELYPTQLMSAIGNFLIFAVLMLVGYIAAKKGKTLRPYTLTGLYLCLYAVGRFVVEIFRADPRRMLFGLSSNQYMSFLFLAAGLILILRKAKDARPKATAA